MKVQITENYKQRKYCIRKETNNQEEEINTGEQKYKYYIHNKQITENTLCIKQKIQKT